MSGLSKQRSKYLKLMVITVAIYLLLSIAITYFLINIPNQHNQLMEEKVTTIKNEISRTIAQTSSDNTYLDFSSLINDNEMQLIVNQGNRVLFSSTSITDYNEVLNSSQKSNIFHSSNYELENNNQNYQVGLIVYNMEEEAIVKNIVLIFLIASSLIMVVTIMIIYFFSQSLLKPLRGLESNIRKLSEYKFEGIENNEEKIALFSKELYDFANGIKTKTTEIELAYTSLEKELLAKEESNIHKKELVSSLVHDLKTPLSLIKMQANLLMRSIVENEPKTLVKEIDESAGDVMGDVKEILSVVNNDYIADEMLQIDLIKTLKKSINPFKELFKEKDLYLNLELLAEATIVANKIEMESVINNALSNIYRYAKKNSEVKINLVEEEKEYYLYFINKVNNIEEIDFENAFTIFNVNKDHNDSSGLGLFLIKKFIERNNGECSFEKVNDVVVLTMILKKEGVIDEEQ